MNLIIKSKQIYDDHEDEIEEKYENYEINILDKSIMIIYNDNKIIFDKLKNIITINKLENSIFIELNKENEILYKTLYGNCTLKTIGEEFFISYKPFKLVMRYKVILEDIVNYKNIIEIFEL